MNKDDAPDITVADLSMNRTWRRFRRWLMNGRLPLFLVPLSLRRRHFDLRARRALTRERDRLFKEMWDAVDAEPDAERHLQIFEDYNARISRPNERLDDLRVRRLEEYAIKHGLEFDWFAVNAPPATPGSVDWLDRFRARDHLARIANEERWRRKQRVATVITPILSLLVALVALLTTRACGGSGKW